MAEKSLWFRMFGEDRVTPVFRKVGAEAEITAAKVRASFAEAGAMIGGPIGKGTKEADKAFGKMSHGTVMAAGVMIGAIGLIAYHTTKMAADYQKSMTLLETGAGESAAQLKNVGNGILQMAGQVGYMPAELAKGMYLIESAGFHGARGLKVLRAAAEGAKADGADLAVVGDALTTVMTDMHAPASQASTVMSQMVRAVGLGKMRMDDLAASIHSVLPNASAAGLSFAQVGGAIATMTAEGIGAEQASQNLNHTIVKLLAPTQGMTSAMASYGLNADVVKRRLGKEGLTGTFEMLANAIFRHMGPAGLTLRNSFNQSQAAAADANKALGAMHGPAQKLAAEYLNGHVSLAKFKKSVKELPTDQAALAMQFKAMADRTHGFSDALKSGKSDAQTFSGAMKDMLGDQTGLQVALHLTGAHLRTFKDNVKTVGGTHAEAGGHVRDWHTIQGNFTQQTDKAKASLSALGISIGTDLLPYMSKLATALSSGVTWMTKHKKAVELGLVVLGALAGAIIAVTAVTVVWNLAMSAGPIGLVVIALAGLVAGLVYAYNHFAWFHHAVVVVWTWIKDHWKVLVPILLTTFFGPLGLLLGVVITHFGDFMKAGEEAFNGIMTAAKWMWNNVLMPVFKSLVGGIAWIMGKWGDMLSAMSHIPGFGWAKGAADAMHAAARQAQGLADALGKIPDHKPVTVDVNYVQRNHGKPDALPLWLQPGNTGANALPGLLNPGGVVTPRRRRKGHNALGTDNWRGGWTEVGETGPEDIYLPPHAQVLSHARTVAATTARAIAGPGGGTMHLSDQDIGRLTKALLAARPLYGDVKLQPHNYNEFRREMESDRRSAAIGAVNFVGH